MLGQRGAATTIETVLHVHTNRLGPATPPGQAHSREGTMPVLPKLYGCRPCPSADCIHYGEGDRSGDISDLLVLRDHLAAILFGLIVCLQRYSLDAGPQSKRCPSPIAPSPPCNKKVAALGRLLPHYTTCYLRNTGYFPYEVPSFGR